ncbi:MAG: hypothetical protein WC796_05055 [Candidatus Pacearchaeota archaeon]|jgi:hypothetical protein
MAIKKDPYEKHAAGFKNEKDVEEELEEDGERIDEIDKGHFEDDDIDKELENDFEDDDW